MTAWTLSPRSRTAALCVLSQFRRRDRPLAFFRLRDLPLTPESVRAAVLSWGALAPLAYVAVLALRPFLFFPSTLLFIAAGLAFGPGSGRCTPAIGGTVAARGDLRLARSLGPRVRPGASAGALATPAR